MASRHRGLLRITSPRLLAALGLPDGTELLDIEWERNLDSLVLHLGGHPDLPIVAEGHMIPSVHVEQCQRGSVRGPRFVR